jgi:urease accessory protein
MADMLMRLGAHLRDVVLPFTPEGGAYGHGRTHGHSHGGAHDDPHGHTHDHTHG